MTPAPPTPVSREVVLVGGGHSHALALRMLGMSPWPGVQITVISDVSHAPYSGMIPGHIAGHYSWEQTHIDLRRLCGWAGARFLLARTIGLDLQSSTVLLENRPPVAFDLASINVGSTPNLESVPGAAQHATPAKPVPAFLASWDKLKSAASGRTARVLVVGAGAGGVEVALAMKARLGSALEVTLIHQGSAILPTHAPGVRKRLLAALRHAGVTVVTGEPVIEVHDSGLTLRNHSQLNADSIIWTTQASAPAWFRASGLAVDDAGFIVVDASLQSVSHDRIFAAGDCATVRHAPRPKSGVFAVRAARPLLTSLERRLAGLPPKPWRPQSRFLSLIGTGNKRAVVSRGPWAAEGAWAWRWKDRIDRAFMRKFEDLPAMDAPPPPRFLRSSLSADLERQSVMRCLGCAGKVGGSILHRVLHRLRREFPHVITPPPDRHDIIAGLDAPDDAAVIHPPAGQAVVQTTDHLSTLVSDPHLFGRIATIHSMSDILAMGATPHSALATALVPFAAEPVTEEWLFQLLSGIATELATFNALLLGGHTAEAPAHALTLTCTGLAQPDTLWQKKNLRPGDTLILTKPLGTGTLFAAAMRHHCPAHHLDTAIQSMLVSNQAAARAARSHHAHTATDITGFGLLGHLLEMLRASHLSATLNLDALPALPGAINTASLGFLSSLHTDNSLALHSLTNLPSAASHPKLPLLTDPQTSGGLLIAVPQHHSQNLLAALHSANCPDASAIGTVTPSTTHTITLQSASLTPHP